MTIRVDRPRRDAVGAVFVTQDPDNGFPDRVARVRTQVCRVVIVDNGSSETAQEGLRRAFGGDGTELILNGENLGVATALNQGMRRLAAASCGWALTFDQDSEAEPFLLDALIEAWDRHPRRDRVAVVGSNYRDERRGKILVEESEELPPWIEAETVITSGSMVSLAAYGEVGPFRDDFFVDHVDDEYCLRALAKGFRVILARRAGIRHSIGSAKAARVFGRSVWTSNHSAVRRYYMARNFTVLAKEYLFSRPGWVLSRLVRHTAFTVLMVLLESDRREKLRGLAAGVRDGVAGRMGAFRV